MAFQNTVIVMGNLAAKPEAHYTSNGTPVCTINVASNEVRTDREGEKHEHTEWHRIILWNKQAENFAKFAKKGDLVHVQGRLRTRSYETAQKVEVPEGCTMTDLEGNVVEEFHAPVTKYVTELHAERSQILTPRSNQDRGGMTKEDSEEVPTASEENIPF